MMQQYNVTGMSCAACSARVEKAVNGIEGVTSCSVSLLTNSMGVEGTASDYKSSRSCRIWCRSKRQREHIRGRKKQFLRSKCGHRGYVKR